MFTFFPWLTDVSGSVTYFHSIKIKQKTNTNSNITTISFSKSKIKKLENYSIQ